MNIQDSWERALRSTEIIKPRVQPLQTFTTTHLPYVFLSESSVNSGDTVVRKGEVLVERPSIILPQHMPQFEGFDFEEKMHMSDDLLKSFFLVRGVTIPPLKYNNKTDPLDVYEGRLSQAIEHYHNRLLQEEDVHTGLISGAEDVWQFSVIIFICSQVSRSADGDMRKLLDEMKRWSSLS